MTNKFAYSLFIALSLSATSAHADVADKAKEVKNATVQVAKKTGETVADAASTVVATRRTAHKTADIAVKAYDKTKAVTQDAVGTAAAKTKEAVAKVGGAVKGK